MRRKPAYETRGVKIRELQACLNTLSEKHEENRPGGGELQAINILNTRKPRWISSLAERKPYCS
jgi:hypothetical protein